MTKDLSGIVLIALIAAVVAVGWYFGTNFARKV